MRVIDPRQISVLCCSVLQAEVEYLLSRDFPGLTIRFLNSMLHMKPDKLAVCLEKSIEEENGPEHMILLVYGDCCARMTDFTKRPGVARLPGNNCCELLLGKEEYRRLARQGAFFLFPEWLGRWRHIFNHELGLNHENAVNLMGDMHKKLVYLDTGLTSIPETDLLECSEYCGLPLEIRTVSLKALRSALCEALQKLTEPQTAVSTA